MKTPDKAEHLSDIEIAQRAELYNIKDIAAQLGIEEDDLEMYGRYKAKISQDFIKSLSDRPDGKLVLVTAINPTPAGEGKTTQTIGIGEAMGRLGKKAVIALREPSLGPCFGIKGGAAGGGMAQVVPMEELNLHFTGDFHAITTANNLCAALLDNHIHQGNELRIDTRRIVLKRCLDLNDRALRNVVVGLGAKSDGFVREDHFTITVASEVMAIFCLATDMDDLKERLSKMLVAYDLDGKPVTAADINAVGAMAALLKDAIKPNLIQTLEHTPVLVHGGPFANIAHGCNSVIATKTALKLADIVITEAGFGADLGAEKFFDIKCRKTGLKPSCAVIVATARALKYNGRVAKDKLNEPDMDALKSGIANLGRHIDNIKKYGLPVIVALNAFIADTVEEIEFIKKYVTDKGCRFSYSEAWEKGGEGAEDLAETIIRTIDEDKADFHLLYPDDMPLRKKIETIACEIYGASGVDFPVKALKQLEEIEAMGCGDLPVCMAKTQYSFTDDPTVLGAPEDFRIGVRDIYLSGGAGFVVALTGDIMTMPGLSAHPAAYDIDVDDEGKIRGLF